MINVKKHQSNIYQILNIKFEKPLPPSVAMSILVMFLATIQQSLVFNYCI